MTDSSKQPDQQVARTARSEIISISILAVGGSILGGLIITILGYVLARVNYPARSGEWSAELLAAAMGMGLSIPVGIIGGGLAGTGSAKLLVNVDSRRRTLIASIAALVVGALVSGVVLAPGAFFLWILEHI